MPLIEPVKVGSRSLYCFDFGSSVMVRGAWVIVKAAPSCVIVVVDSPRAGPHVAVVGYGHRATAAAAPRLLLAVPASATRNPLSVPVSVGSPPAYTLVLACGVGDAGC